MFQYFKNKKLRKSRAVDMYNEIVQAARQPVFYQEFSIPDTVDGRFEMIALHSYIMTHRLNRMGEMRTAQKLFDVMFVNIDRTLREMGIGDLAVPKHMKRMMQGFNGRCVSYEKALGNQEDMKQALVRNAYGTVGAPFDHVMDGLIEYIECSCAIDSLETVFAPLSAPKDLKQYA